jgi:hypothetical protein
VDNLNSDADVFFIDPSTQFQLQVPARTEGLFPVEMSGSKFIVSAPLAAASDSVNFQAYNYVPPPFTAIPPFLTSSNSQLAGGNQTASLTAAGNTQIIPAPTSGIVTAVDISYDNVVSGAASGTVILNLEDGLATPTILLFKRFTVIGAAASVNFAQIFSLTGLALRFRNGLVFSLTTSGTAFTSGTASINVLFR